eukprot:3472829-Karenia_brevis.AAC.1
MSPTDCKVYVITYTHNMIIESGFGSCSPGCSDFHRRQQNLTTVLVLVRELRCRCSYRSNAD